MLENDPSLVSHLRKESSRHAPFINFWVHLATSLFSQYRNLSCFGGRAMCPRLPPSSSFHLLIAQIIIIIIKLPLDSFCFLSPCLDWGSDFQSKPSGIFHFYFLLFSFDGNLQIRKKRNINVAYEKPSEFKESPSSLHLE